MKILGFNIGQYGDLAINTVACKIVKEKFSNSKLYFAISKKYEDCKEAFLNNQYIDDIFLVDGYNDYPTIKDLERMKENNFDIIFNGMENHKNPYWFLNYHQSQEVCFMHGLMPPTEEKDFKINLTKYWNDEEKYKNYVAISPFGSFGQIKSIDFNKIKEIIKYLKSLGFNVLLVKGPADPEIEGADETTNCSYFESIKKVTSCKFLITVDTGMCWFISAYNHPTIGLYGYNFYPNCHTSKNWQPINKNAIYLEKDYCNNIEIYDIIKAIEELKEKTK